MPETYLDQIYLFGDNIYIYIYIYIIYIIYKYINIIYIIYIYMKTDSFITEPF